MKLIILKPIVIVILCLLNTLNVNAQNTWTQKSSSPTSAVLRSGAFSFTIGTKSYVGGGTDAVGTVLKSFWEYDPALDIWTQKADLPDIGSQYGRVGAVGFGIGNLGYFGTGNTSGSANGTNNFYEYNPSTNTWTPKANFAGGTRAYAIGFSIGNKGYIGTGLNSPTLLKDFWEYNPSTDAWTQKANFGGLARDYAIGFSIKGKGYIGTGNDNSGVYTNDFWEYDTITDLWLQKANFGGGKRWVATGFSIGDFGYIGTGQDSLNADKNDFWEYNSKNNTWIQKTNFSGNIRSSAFCFSVNNKGYIGGGFKSPAAQFDFWEYTPCGIDVTVSETNDVLVSNQNGATYKWLDCNNSNSEIPSATSQSYTPTSNGNYAVEVTIGTCTYTSSCVVYLSTGLKYNSSNKNDLNIYPNPNNGVFTVKSNQASAVKISNELGEVVKEVTLNSKNSYEALVEGLSQGIYFVTGSSNEKSFNQKIVVVK